MAGIYFLKTSQNFPIFFLRCLKLTFYLLSSDNRRKILRITSDESLCESSLKTLLNPE